MTSLPSLRRKILRSFSVLIGLYAVLGAFLLSGVFFASSMGPRILHLNYDSIAAGNQMKEALTALKFPERHREISPSEWKSKFEKALTFELGNITEAGEGERAQKVRSLWSKSSQKIGDEAYAEMERLLGEVVQLNETGMFRAAKENTEFGRKTLIVSLIFFLITLISAFFVADGLANRLSRPLKSIAEALHRRPKVGSRLKLIEPNSLELLILTTELKGLWERVTESEKVNVLELIQQKRKLEAVLESVEDALLVVQRDGTVSQCNECMLSLLGLPLGQVYGLNWSDLPTARENYMKLRAALRDGMPDSNEIELVLDNEVHQFSARSRAIGGADQPSTATLYLLHDITERRHRERFRAEFIDLLSHEIKTPLQSLGTASELLVSQRQVFPENLRLLVDTVSEDVSRIRAVANEFVQVTQSHAKIMKLILEPIALNQAIPEWIKPFRVVARDRKVNLCFRQEGSVAIMASVDPVKFPWVISNLLSNAIRFAPPDTEVEVLLTDRNGGVEIQVNDKGPGISDEDQRRMFEPFFQSTMMTSTGKHGLFGIGLTIAKEVVEAHEGRIEYYRMKPHGSEFRIFLPFPARATFHGSVR